ncbi:FecR family protein [Sphingobacterium corticibacter]|uniref:FecR family protein n=1 Tax=Sphingobacterium corticibacter TaxID=2171749 RepID=A0A2T8HN06_9SPHI|nr:FecR family protein [Sphingobacterium corticibacter]PVH26790.1 hypothetical protein DC487_04085 [Sphingobacterium corticibacter]
MFRNRDLVKIFLLSIFSRYKRGKATRAEQKLVEKFFDQVEAKAHNRPTSDLSKIKSQMKKEIDRQLAGKQTVKYPFRRIFMPAAAILLIFLTFSTMVNWRGWFDDHSFAAGKKTQNGPTLTVGNLQYANLLDSVPKEARYLALNEEKVLDLSAMQSAHAEDSLIITNPTKTAFAVLLSDGTIARLASGARIAYQWNEASPVRKLRMEGKVSFDVAKMERLGRNIPFFVETAIQQVAVLGTVFTVDANSRAEHSVHLHEGSVRLSHHTSHDQVLLRPGQTGFVAADNPRIYVASAGANKQKLMAWRKQQFYFDDQPLRDVMTELSEWYGKDIVVQKSVQNLPITGIISRYKQLEDILDIIQMTNTITYYEKKGVIYVGLK